MFLNIIALLSLLLFSTAPVKAHSPQHVVDALELSPTNDVDETAFIIVQNHLLRTTTAGATWKQIVNGINNKYILSSVVFSPDYANDRAVFLASDGDGVYKSIDQGDSWTTANGGLDSKRIGILAISPFFEKNTTLLAASADRGLYFTANGGESWETVLRSSLITAIAFDRNEDSGGVIAGDDTGTLWLSNDNGKTWRQYKELADAGRITALLYETPRMLFVGTEKQGIYRSNDNGETFTNLRNNLSSIPVDCGGRILDTTLTNNYITSIAAHKKRDLSTIIFATGWYDALFVSNDDGKSWQKLSDGLSCDDQADRDYDEPVPHFRYVRLSPNFNVDGTLFIAGFDGIFKSTDSGHHWRQLEPLPVSLIRGFDLAESAIDSLALAITTYGGGAYISENNGTEWRVSNIGLKTTRLSGIAFSPDYQNDRTIFTGSDGHVLKSTDQGRTWKRISITYRGWRRKLSGILRRRLGFPPNYSSELLLSDAERTRYWPMLVQTSPDYQQDHTLFIGTRRHGAWSSTDRGTTWEHSWEDVRDFTTALAVSPNYSQDRTVFVAERGNGIFRSTDGGEKWHAVNDGFKYLERITRPVRPNYNVDSVLFSAIKDIGVAISPDYKDSGTLFASSAEGLFKTTNGGSSWVILNTSIDIADENVEHIAISPNYASDQTVFVSVKGKGLFVTDDGGETFRETGHQLIRENQSIKILRFSPNYSKDRTIYAASEENIYRSKDSGSTWLLLARPVRYENWRGEGKGPVKYTGDWAIERGNTFSASSISKAEAANSSATLDFFGSGIHWIGRTAPDHGIAKVFLDGKLYAEIDQYSKDAHNLATLLTISSLPTGPHSITIRNSDKKNASATAHTVSVDAFDIMLD